MERGRAKEREGEREGGREREREKERVSAVLEGSIINDAESFEIGKRKGQTLY